METSYVSGSGLLFARGRRWLLVNDDPPMDRVDEWWHLLGTAGAGLHSSERVAHPPELLVEDVAAQPVEDLPVDLFGNR